MKDDDPYTCVTCSDRALPGRILVCHGTSAEAEIDGTLAEIDVQLVSPVTVGDVVLVHQGVAISRIHERGIPDARSEMARLFPDLIPLRQSQP